MKKDMRDLTVICAFTENGENLRELLLQSLRSFIERNVLSNAVF